MKAIISHDVDHMTAWEHYKDSVLPKFIIRSLAELVLGGISRQEFCAMMQDLKINKWQNLRELMRFDREYGVPSTFFLATHHGPGLSYSLNKAETWCKEIQENGFEVGAHGICFDNLNQIKREFEKFKQITGLNQFGIRMHNFRMNQNTLEYLCQSGYMYDSSLYAFENPKVVGRMVEFPVNLMDASAMYSKGKVKTVSFTEAQEYTKRKIDRASQLNLRYINVLSHDQYFCPGFETYQKWYIWLIEFLRENDVEFVSYSKAINESMGV